MSTTLRENGCPICGRADDHIYRVSGLLASGTRKDDTLNESLRQALAAPARPARPLGFEVSWQGLLLATLFAVAAFPAANHLWLLLPAGLGALSLIALRLQGRAWQRQQAQWEKKRANWDALYYCFYDDRVFLPGHAEAMPPYLMHKLLA